jgi:hypothetical protein
MLKNLEASVMGFTTVSRGIIPRKIPLITEYTDGNKSSHYETIAEIKNG